MNKKFLSAILFGALMVTSTGTFVSCKDYDDDIDRIDNTLNDLKSQLAALQKLVGEGKWVTSISSIENGFTVTMSDGSSQTVKGINGVDGKNGTEWSIGEDGFWYKDGEKTTSQAVAKDGKPGATAPSPSINADGYWVIYEWDATAGEFVAKTSEISAKGTNAYVVAKDGVYVLNIANEKGEFVQVTLPATADSFVAEAPFGDIRVLFEAAKWNPATTNAVYQKLAKEFPAIAEIAKGELLKQGGKLPLLVTPSAVELTDNMNFSLQGVKGEYSKAAVAKPIKGLPATTSIENDYVWVWNEQENGYFPYSVGEYMQTRSAGTNDCFWTLEVEPALNKQGTGYENITEKQSLVIENEKGTVVKTAFAYTVKAIQNRDVSIGKALTNVDYAPEIDLFAKNENNQSVFTINNGYANYFILEVTDPATIEKYGITIDGSTLKIATMPADKNSITIPVKLTALGLNGSTKVETQTITVSREIEAIGVLADKVVTLTTTANSQLVLWNIADFKFTAVQKQQFVEATKNMVVTYFDESGDEQTSVTYNGLKCYKEDGKTETTVYTEAAKFGFTLQNATLAPRDNNYKVRLNVIGGGSTIFADEATLTIVNPKAEDIFKLADYYTEGGVLQITGDYSTGMITYNLADGIVAPTYATLVTSGKQFIDLDNAAWLESTGSTTDMGAISWVAEDGKSLSVNKYVATAAANKKQLYVERNIRGVYKLFNNANNIVNYDFKVFVKSAVYDADPTKVISLTATKLTTEFDDADGINVKDGITAKYAAGKNRGKEYSLFDGAIGEKKTTYQIYTAPKTNVSSDGAITYAIDKNGVMVQVDLNDMAAFGFSADAILDAQKEGKYYVITALTDATAYKYYKDVKTLGDLWTAVSKYYDAVEGDDGETGYKRNTDKVADADAAIFNLFTKYVGASKVAFDTTVKTTPVPATVKAAEIESTAFGWVAENEAEKYVDTTASDIANGKIVAKKLDDINEDLVDGKAIVKVKLTVTDKWGMKMVRTIDVTLTAPAE